MGNTYSPPPFSLFTQSPSLWLPTATHGKKKRSSPQGEGRHSNCLHQSNSSKHPSELHVAALRFHRQNNLRVCVLGAGRRLPAPFDGTRSAEKKVKEIKPQRESTDVQQLISLTGCLRRRTQCKLHIQAPSLVR